MTAPTMGDAAPGAPAPPGTDSQIIVGAALQQQLAAFSLQSSTAAASGQVPWPATTHWQQQQQQPPPPLRPASPGSDTPEGPEHAAAGGLGQAPSGLSTPGPSAARLSGEGGGSCPLARELGVSLSSLVRLFTADRSDEFDQPVWMVVNLQGKIKGSYTADKMIEFCKRGTLSSKQLVLGIDRNLPYALRQDRAYYAPLGRIARAVAGGAAYLPLTVDHTQQQPDGSLAAPHWQPLALRGGDAVGGGHLPDLSAPTGGVGDALPASSGAMADPSGHTGVAQQAPAGSEPGAGPGGATPGSQTAAASLRQALQRLLGGSVVRPPSLPPAAGGACGERGAELAGAGLISPPASPGGSSSRDPAGQLAAGAAGGRAGPLAGEGAVGAGRAPLWLYINHLGWCRGPFSGPKLMHAHLCGRLPKDTLVAGYDPGVPTFMLSADPAAWFRPLGALLDNMGGGWAYVPISWEHVMARASGSTQPWAPLVAVGQGPPPPLVSAGAVLQPPALPAASAAAAKGSPQPVGSSLRRNNLPGAGASSISSSGHAGGSMGGRPLRPGRGQGALYAPVLPQTPVVQQLPHQPQPPPMAGVGVPVQGWGQQALPQAPAAATWVNMSQQPHGLVEMGGGSYGPAAMAAPVSWNMSGGMQLQGSQMGVMGTSLGPGVGGSMAIAAGAAPGIMMGHASLHLQHQLQQQFQQQHPQHQQQQQSPAIMYLQPQHQLMAAGQAASMTVPAAVHAPPGLTGSSGVARGPPGVYGTFPPGGVMVGVSLPASDSPLPPGSYPHHLGGGLGYADGGYGFQ